MPDKTEEKQRKFQKGRSGNPLGRPKGTRNKATLLAEKLLENEAEEIIKYRASLRMSQTAFANYLKVGEASIKRWETYFVQDVVQDDHIRLKCDGAYAEFNALEVHWKSQSSDIYSGNRLFCLELFKQAVRYLIGFTKSPF